MASPFTAYAECTPTSSSNYNATQWYRDSAEKTALYNQIYAIGLEKVTAKVKKMKKDSWGVVLDIDETVLDNSEYQKRNVLSCSPYNTKTNYAFMEEKVSVAAPGAINFTCSIQKLGGRVILVTNRNGIYDDKIQEATVDNLEAQGICFDNVVFANGDDDRNKTPRFIAITKGDYSNILATEKLAPLKVVAYFGDNIQDFPNIKQTDAIKQTPDSKYFQKFGQEYFSLPNPTYGSWEKNEFK